ncbi:MAG TPA: ABC transporter ATP-binding protein, partial [Verrucomicrobiae bacterium]|nr:ABC transporter ATP-binding protein [Verrucomicrobiae bacterium]
MIVCDQIERRFPGARGEVAALAGVSLTVERGEFVAVKGPSGCGKSTLLLALGGMQRPSAGRVVLEGQDLYALPAPHRNRIRAERIGFVFQLFHLIPFLTVRENIVAGLPPGTPAAEPARRIDELMDQLGLQQRAGERPGTLSAGERQRVALARALIKRPALILADEPTGNLDPENAGEVFRHLAAFQHAGGTVVVVTHGNDAQPHAGRV